MNVDRLMRKISKVEFKHTKFSPEHINIENQYKALRTTLQKLKPLILWFQSYDENESMTKSFKKIIDKVGKSKSSINIEKTGNYKEIALVISENEENLENVEGFSLLNRTLKKIDEKKGLINNELTQIIRRLEEALNTCKEIDISRNECKDIQYKSERAYQKKEEYKYDSELKAHESKTFDSMKKLLEGGLGTLIIDINDIFCRFHNIINETEE